MKSSNNLNPREITALAKRYGITRGQAAAMLWSSRGAEGAVTVAAAVERGKRRAWVAPKPRAVLTKG